jgi:aminoglycoside 6'-N-acetyltransferase
MDNTQNIILRLAKLADAPLLTHWDKQQHVIDAAPNDSWDWEHELPLIYEWRELLIAELYDRPIGFIQIIDPEIEETHYWGDSPPNLRALDIWIGESTDLGKGYGTVMMNLTLKRCFANPTVTAVLIDPLASNTNAIRFYERIGFKFVEYRRFDEDDCAVYQITRADWQEKNKI